jgi:hypothetical protein
MCKKCAGRLKWNGIDMNGVILKCELQIERVGLNVYEITS